MPVGERTMPVTSTGGIGGTVMVDLKAKTPDQAKDEVILNQGTPAAAPAAPAPAAQPAPQAAPAAPVAAPAVAPQAAPVVPSATPVDPNLLDALNREFVEKGEISQETLAGLASNPNLPKGFDQYVATYAMLAANRRNDNKAAAREIWGANADAIEESISQNPAVAASILVAPNVASARLAAQNILASYAAQNSTAPRAAVVGSGSGGAPGIPAGVPKNAAEKYRLVTDPRYLYNLDYMNKVNSAIQQGITLGIDYTK